MANAQGSRGWVGFKPEATPGTAETTVTTFLASESFGMDKNMTPIARKAHYGSGVALAPRLGWIKPDGKAPTEVMASQPHPWYWALGNVVTTQPAVSTDPTVYLHTIIDDAYAGSKQNSGGAVSLTCEGNRVFDQAKQSGVKLSKLKLTAKPGEIAHLELEWMGLAHTDGATLTSTPTFVTDVLTCRSVLVKIDGTPDLTVDQCDIEWDGGLESIAVLEGASGSPHTIRRKNFPKTSGKLSFIDFPTAQLAKLTAATPFALIVEIQGDVISHTYSKFLRVTLPACAYTGGLKPTIGEDVVTGDADFEAYYDTTTGLQIKVEAQNTISAINA